MQSRSGCLQRRTYNLPEYGLVTLGEYGLVTLREYGLVVGTLVDCAWYLYTALGRRVPTRTPSTAHLLCLPFFAFLVGGLPVGLVATSSARSS